MARVRLLDPGFFTNEHLVELPFEYRLLFAGLWTLADREGRLEDRPKRIRMAIFPCDNVDCDAGLQALHDAGMVKRYSVEGIAYVAILAFSKHQKPHPRETSSVIPAPQGEPKARPRQTKGAPEDDEKLAGCMADVGRQGACAAADGPRLAARPADRGRRPPRLRRQHHRPPCRHATRPENDRCRTRPTRTAPHCRRLRLIACLPAGWPSLARSG